MHRVLLKELEQQLIKEGCGSIHEGRKRIKSSFAKSFSQKPFSKQSPEQWSARRSIMRNSQNILTKLYQRNIVCIETLRGGG